MPAAQEAEKEYGWVCDLMVDLGSLPEGWVAYYDEGTGRQFYNNLGSGDSVWEHPALGFFSGILVMERGGRKELEANERENPPTAEEVEAMMDYFEILPGDPAPVQAVASMAVNAPLPEGWEEEQDADGDAVFRDPVSGELMAEHPLDSYFRELVARRRKGLEDPAPPKKEDDVAELLKNESIQALIRREVQSQVRKARGDSDSDTDEESGSDDDLADIEGRLAAIEADNGGATPRSVGFDTPRGEGDPYRTPEVRLKKKKGKSGKKKEKEGKKEIAQKNEKIFVCVRARPLQKVGKKPAWMVDPSKNAVYLRNDTALKRNLQFYGEGRKGRDRAQKNVVPRYVFDAVVPESEDTRSLYTRCIRPVALSALEGINGTVFAYGQTGSGKTHTIVGSKSSPGALVMAVNDMFDNMKSASKRRDYLLKVGMFEIYNEELRDLLANPHHRLAAGERLQIKEDPIMGVRVMGMHEEIVHDAGRIQGLIARGAKSRTTASTKMNVNSSRSHTIFRMVIQSKAKGKTDSRSVKVSVLNFVDLAGSERLRKSGSVGARAHETTHINLSLMTLGTVISKLADGKKGEFVPYRNSKLTRILQPSLGGNAKTAIIATIALTEAHAEETSHTLRFAARAKNVINYVQVNEVGPDQTLVQKYKREIQGLYQQLQAQAGGRGFDQASPELVARVQELENENSSLHQKIESMKAKGTSDSPPPSPTNVNLPSPSMHAKKAGLAKMPLEKAVQALARAAGVGRAGGGASGNATPDTVLVAIRQLRSERDELRRLYKKKEKMTEEKKQKLVREEEWRAERPQLESMCHTLEDLSGGKSTRDTLIGRLEEAVDSAVIAYAELAALERQHKELGKMIRENEAITSRLEAKAKKAAALQDRVVELETNEMKTKEKLATLQKKRDEFAVALGEDPKALDDITGGAVPGGAAMNYANTLEKHLKAEKENVHIVQRERDNLRKRLTAALGVAKESDHDVGSPAVVAAREAKATAKRLEAENAALKAEVDKMKEKLDSVQEHLLAEEEKPKEEVFEEDDEKAQQINKMKQRIYNLSKEVAALRREKDELKKELEQGGLGSARKVTYTIDGVDPNAISETMEANQSLLEMASPRLSGYPSSSTKNSKWVRNKFKENLRGGRSPQPRGFDTRPVPLLSKNERLRQDRSMSLRYEDRKHYNRPTDTWNMPQHGSADEENFQLRRRLVEAERARHETAQRAQVQSRAAQLQQQATDKANAQISALASQLQRSVDHMQLMQKQLNSERMQREHFQNQMMRLEKQVGGGGDGGAS